MTDQTQTTNITWKKLREGERMKLLRKINQLSKSENQDDAVIEILEWMNTEIVRLTGLTQEQFDDLSTEEADKLRQEFKKKIQPNFAEEGGKDFTQGSGA